MFHPSLSYTRKKEKKWRSYRKISRQQKIDFAKIKSKQDKINKCERNQKIFTSIFLFFFEKKTIKVVFMLLYYYVLLCTTWICNKKQTTTRTMTLWRTKYILYKFFIFSLQLNFLLCLEFGFYFSWVGIELFFLPSSILYIFLLFEYFCTIYFIGISFVIYIRTVDMKGRNWFIDFYFNLITLIIMKYMHSYNCSIGFEN